jgi:hypothetical protein
MQVLSFQAYGQPSPGPSSQKLLFLGRPLGRGRSPDASDTGDEDRLLDRLRDLGLPRRGIAIDGLGELERDLMRRLGSSTASHLLMLSLLKLSEARPLQVPISSLDQRRTP